MFENLRVAPAVGLNRRDASPKEAVCNAVRSFETSKADFADCLIERIGGTHDCEYTATFDKGAADAGMRLIA